MAKTYEIQLEISGPNAMWTRPDTGSAPISAPAPTFSAAKGIFESILMHKSTVVSPIRTEICAPVQYQRYVTNYGGPLRKSTQISAGEGGYQLIATVLTNVCYRLYALVEDFAPGPAGVNSRHAFQAQFERRLRQGKWHRVPCLGWSEFLPDYVGPFREETQVAKVSEILPSLLHMVFDKRKSGAVEPRFCRNVEILDGVLHYNSNSHSPERTNA